MGSGKTTVGKILAEVLGYSFFDRFVFLSDNELHPPPKSSIRNLFAYGLQMLLANSDCSDKLVEKAVGISSVAEIFQLHSEAFFRDNEVICLFL